MQRIFLYTTLLLLSMSCSLELPENIKSLKTGNNFTIEMIPVAGGTFQMGNSVGGETNEMPVHSVSLSDFDISKYEITQTQWKFVMETNPSFFTNCDTCPVENVSWEDIQLFLTKLNKYTSKTYRLPTEAEWQYVARGGKLSKGYTYSGSNTIGDVAWYSDNSGIKTHPVGQKTANELGVYDMTGNVGEWCSDLYGLYTANLQQNPTGVSTGYKRVLRGGSFFFTPQFSRVANRSDFSPVNRYSDFGFRVVSSQ